MTPRDKLSKGTESNSETEFPAKPQSRSRRWPILGTIVAILCVLGLALGLGLGLGLKHKTHATSTANSYSIVKTVLRDQLVDPSQFILSPSFDINAPPQPREYNWTISEIYANPTGTFKNMLVVNDMSPGPTIEANIGDKYVRPSGRRRRHY